MAKKNRTPAEEEAAAKRRAAGLEKARNARAKKARAKTADLIWKVIEPKIESNRCQCGLKKGMTLEDLRKLNAGCTSPYDYYHSILKESPPWAGMSLAEAKINGFEPVPGWVCTVLDSYRRYLEKPSSLEDYASA